MNAKERRKLKRSAAHRGPDGPKIEMLWIEPDPEHSKKIKQWRVQPFEQIVDLTPPSVIKELGNTFGTPA